MLRTFLVDLNNVDNLPFEQKLRFSPPNKHLRTEQNYYVLFGIMPETLVKTMNSICCTLKKLR